MKDSYYFSHDYNSRSDPKLVKLIMKHGMEGLGIYWCIIEMLYEQKGYIKLNDIDSIAFELRTECDRINSLLKNFGLFKFKKDVFYSESVIRRINIRNEKSNKNRENALKRWNKDSNKDANAMRTQCERNAIKGKERKVNKRKEYKEMDYVIEPFKLSFIKWLDYKKERQETYKSETSLKSCYNKLFELSGGDPIIADKIIEQSMANNWAGLFALKNNNNNKTQVDQPFTYRPIKHDRIITDTER